MWRQQSVATRREYATAGSRYHLTGFQYWMKYHLTNLPDIAGMWHLDEKSGAIATDFSRNGNHGTIIGATPADGVIDGAFYFDGLNDEITLPVDMLASLTQGTFSGFVCPLDKGDIFRCALDANNYVALFIAPAGPIRIKCKILGAVKYEFHTPALPLTQFYHFAWTKTGTTHIVYYNGIVQPLTWITNVDPSIYFSNIPSPAANSFGIIWTTGWLKGYLDNPILHSTPLDQPSVIRHSLRRYPS